MAFADGPGVDLGDLRTELEADRLAIVTVNRETVQQVAGLDLFLSVLATRSWLTSRLAWPIAVIGSKEATLVLRDLERENIANSGTRVTVNYFSAYPHIGMGAPPDCLSTIEEAVLAGAMGERLELDGDIPAVLATRILSKTNNAQLKDSPRTLFFVTPIPRHEVLQSYDRAKQRIMAAALEATKIVPQGDDLVRYFESADQRFTALDSLLAGAGVDCLLAAAPLTIQDLGGSRAVGAAYLVAPREGEYVFALTSAEGGSGRRSGMGPQDLPTAIGQIVDHSIRIACEEGWMSIGDWSNLSEYFTLVPLSDGLSDWRERIARYDLPAYLLTASIGLPAVEEALLQTAHILNQGGSVLEADVDRIYHERVTHNSSTLIGGSVEPWFTLLHSSIRTSRPAFPSSSVINSLSRGVRIIPGLMFRSEDRLIMATAEFARSLPLTAEAKAMYAALGYAAEAAIDAISPGVTGELVHKAAVDALEDSAEASDEASAYLARIGKVSEVFRRDVGLLVGKEQSFRSAFKPGARTEFFEGAVGIVELQWVTGELALGYGEMFFTTNSKAVRLSGRSAKNV